MIRALGNRLQALHIHDNDCWHDSHQIPFSMSIDFDAVVKALKDIHYSGYFTLEASSYLEAFTPETTQKGLCDSRHPQKDFPICLKHCKASDPSYRFSRSVSVFPAAAAVFIYPQAPLSPGAHSLLFLSRRLHQILRRQKCSVMELFKRSLLLPRRHCRRYYPRLPHGHAAGVFYQPEQRLHIFSILPCKAPASIPVSSTSLPICEGNGSSTLPSGRIRHSPLSSSF